jgi:hypothetical protein
MLSAMRDVDVIESELRLLAAVRRLMPDMPGADKPAETVPAPGVDGGVSAGLW